MRILLVNPYYPISETPSPPLGLAFLAAVLEEAGVEVKILDLVVFPYSKEMLQSVLDDFSPHMVGITCVTMSFDHAIQVIKDVKSIKPHPFSLTPYLDQIIKKYASEYLLDKPFLEKQGLFNPDGITRLVKENESKRSRKIQRLLWTLIVFQHWWKKYLI